MKRKQQKEQVMDFSGYQSFSDLEILSKTTKRKALNQELREKAKLNGELAMRANELASSISFEIKKNLPEIRHLFNPIGHHELVPNEQGCRKGEYVSCFSVVEQLSPNVKIVLSLSVVKSAGDFYQLSLFYTLLSCRFGTASRILECDEQDQQVYYLGSQKDGLERSNELSYQLCRLYEGLPVFREQSKGIAYAEELKIFNDTVSNKLGEIDI